MGFSTFATEYNRLQAIAGVPTTSNAARYKEHVNDALEMIVAEHDWAFLRNAYSDAFNTEAPYTTGTVSVTKGSTALTGVSTAWTALTAGATGLYEILLGTEVYGVSITDGTNAVLSRAATATFSGSTYTIFKRVYPLSARMRSIEAAWVLVTPRWPLKVADWLEIATLNSQAPVLTAYPERLAFANIDSDDTSRVILDPIPSAIQSIYYSGYQEVAALSADGTAIPLPKKFKPAFHEAADYFMFKWRDDSRTKMSMDAYRDLVQSLIVSDDPSGGTLDKGNLSPHFFRFVRRGFGREAPSRSGNP